MQTALRYHFQSWSVFGEGEVWFWLEKPGVGWGNCAAVEETGNQSLNSSKEAWEEKKKKKEGSFSSGAEDERWKCWSDAAEEAKEGEEEKRKLEADG